MTDAERSRTGRGANILFVVAAFVVTCAGVRSASTIIIPVLAALFISTVALPPIVWLQRKGSPLWLGAKLVLAFVLGGLLLAGVIAAGAVSTFSQNLPEYTARLQDQFHSLDGWFKLRGINVGDTPLTNILNPAALMGVLGSTLGALVGILRDGVFVFLTTCFILAEAASMPAKLRVAFSIDETAMGPWRRILDDMTIYLHVKTQTSLLTAILVALSLWWIGVPFPLALGLLAFLLNFVPVFGAILAGIPAILLALVLLGPGSALLATAIYTAINVAIGSVVEPKLMGHRLGLSTTVVFLSLVFWGYMLGPVGMLLAVPLTMLAKILLDHTNDLRWLSILLGPAPKEPTR